MMVSGRRQQRDERATPSQAACDLNRLHNESARKGQPLEGDFEQTSLTTNSPGATIDRLVRSASAPMSRSIHKPPEAITIRHTRHLRFLGSKRAVLERQAVATTAALDRVSRLRVLWERQQFFAMRTAHLIGEGREPVAGVPPDPQGEACAVGALHQGSGPDAGR